MKQLYRTVTLTHVFVIALLVGAAALFTGGDAVESAFASAATDESNVTLTVEATTVVTITPTLFNFSEGVGSTNFSESSNLFLRIKNDGSQNITDIYAHLNTLESEQNNPIGLSNSQEFAAGGFLWIKNDTSKMYHAGRLEWNITAAAGGEPAGITNDVSNAISHGFYRNATGDYLWTLSSNYSGSETTYNNSCNDATQNGPALTIKNAVDTGDNRDMSTGVSLYDTNSGGRSNTWSTVLASGGPLDGHYVSIYQDCTRIYISRFDNDGSFGLNDQAGQFLVGPSPGEALTPGTTHDARVGASVPNGVPAGQTNRTLLTITASAQP